MGNEDKKNSTVFKDLDVWFLKKSAKNFSFIFLRINNRLDLPQIIFIKQNL
ncbi:MAG: hypothetical protein ACXVED_07205 [Bacteroidia bacterium]